MQADKEICSLHAIKMNDFITLYYSPFGVKAQSKLLLLFILDKVMIVAESVTHK